MTDEEVDSMVETADAKYLEDLGPAVKALNAEVASLKLQLSEVTAHRDRLRDMMNDVRGLLLCPPTDLEVQIMRRIEDGAITEKRKEEVCRVPLPYGQSGVPDFCGMHKPCPKHPDVGENYNDLGGETDKD